MHFPRQVAEGPTRFGASCYDRGKIDPFAIAGEIIAISNVKQQDRPRCQCRHAGAVPQFYLKALELTSGILHNQSSHLNYKAALFCILKC